MSPVANRRCFGKFFTLIATACLAVALSACGGGGDSSNQSGTFSGSGDLAKLSPTLIKAVLPGYSDGLSGVDLFSAESNRASTLDASAPSRTLMKFVTAAIHKTKAASISTQPGQARALAVETETTTCSRGGSLTTTYDFVNDSEELVPGDRVEFRFNSCVNSNFQTVVGNLQFRVNAVELAANGDLVAYDASVTYQSFGVIGQSLLSGNARFSYREVGTRDLTAFEFQGATTTVNGYAVVLNHKKSNDSGVVTVQGPISINGASYSLSSTNLNYNNANAGYPISGALRIVDARGSAIVITAKGINVGRSYVAAGQTTPELTLSDTAWANIN
jgi:hypothetical protein